MALLARKSRSREDALDNTGRTVQDISDHARVRLVLLGPCRIVIRDDDLPRLNATDQARFVVDSHTVL